MFREHGRLLGSVYVSVEKENSRSICIETKNSTKPAVEALGGLVLWYGQTTMRSRVH